MKNKVKQTILQYELIQKKEHILVALSGGADSVCLLHCLYTLRDELDIQISAVHVNHQLRGADAQRDERFAVSFCKKLGISCYVKHADVKQYAAEHKLSEETAGREIRYAVFNELVQKHGFHKIATAHNKNDSAETILMHFMRGTSLTGLSGIPYIRGNIIRPLLCLTRVEIEQYCMQQQLSYVTDKTNFEAAYTRNKVRLSLIPYIQEEFNQNFITTVTENAGVIASENAFMTQYADTVYHHIVKKTDHGVCISCDALHTVHEAIKRRIIIKCMETVGETEKNLSLVHIRDVLSISSIQLTGKRIILPYGMCARNEYGMIYIEKEKQITEDFEYNVAVGNTVYINEVDICVKIEQIAHPEKDSFYFTDVSDLKIRNRRNGDFFYPVGMTGKKKLKNYLIDEKIPKELRNKLPILVSGNHIVWIIGKRRDRRFCEGEVPYRITVIEGQD